MENKTKGNEPNLVNQHKYKTEHINPLQLSWSSILSGYSGILSSTVSDLLREESFASAGHGAPARCFVSEEKKNYNMTGINIYEREGYCWCST